MRQVPSRSRSRKLAVLVILALAWSLVLLAAQAPQPATNVRVNAALAAPSIALLSPSSGAVGATVTITGVNFNGEQDSGTVTFNGTSATVTAWTATSITTTVPAGATTGNVVVRQNSLNSTGSSFTVTSAGTCDGTSTICVTQAGSGSANGTTGNPRALTFLTTAANWGGGGTEIDPGDTVMLSGTITGDIALAGSGSVGGGVVTIDGTNATLATSSNVTASGRSYVTLTGFTWADGLSGDAVTFSGTNDHLTVANCHAHAITSGNFLYVSGGLNTNVAISGCSIEQATNSNASQQDILKFEGGTGFLVEGNVLTLRANSNCAECHDDIIQTYDSSGVGPPPGTLTIRYNKFVMDSTQSGNKSILQMEQTTGVNYEYGNVFYCTQGAGGANGMAHYSGVSVTWHIYNNSTYAKSGSCENTWSFANSGTLNHRNNIVSSSAGTVYTTAFGTVTRQYNNWFGSNAPSCSGTGEVCGNPLFTSQATGDLTLTASSPGKGTGIVIANTGSHTFDSGPSPSATWPNPTLATRGATCWDQGAYVQSSC